MHTNSKNNQKKSQKASIEFVRCFSSHSQQLKLTKKSHMNTRMKTKEKNTAHQKVTWKQGQTENTIESDFFVMFISFLTRARFFPEDIGLWQMHSIAIRTVMKGRKLKQTDKFQISDLGIWFLIIFKRLAIISDFLKMFSAFFGAQQFKQGKMFHRKHDFSHVIPRFTWA